MNRRLTRSSILLSLILAMSSLGCLSGRFDVKSYDAEANSGNPANGGIVYRMQETFFVVKTVQPVDKDKKPCGEPTTTHEPISVATGQAFSVNVDRKHAWFASNEISIALNDRGALTTATLNSDPQIDEALTATASLVKEVGGVVSGILGAGDDAGDGDGDSEDDSTMSTLESGGECKATGKVEKIKCVIPFETWRSQPSC